MCKPKRLNTKSIATIKSIERIIFITKMYIKWDFYEAFEYMSRLSITKIAANSYRKERDTRKEKKYL